MCLLVITCSSTAATPVTLLLYDFRRGWLLGGGGIQQEWILYEVLILVNQLLHGALFRMQWLA